MASPFIVCFQEFEKNEIRIRFDIQKMLPNCSAVITVRQENKGAVLGCVNKGIIEAAIALQWIKPTRTKRSVCITNQQAPISTEKNKRKVNEVSMKKFSEITASDDITFASIAASSSIPNTPVAAELPPVVELSAVSFVSEVEIDKEGDEEVAKVLMSRSVLFLL